MEEISVWNFRKIFRRHVGPLLSSRGNSRATGLSRRKSLSVVRRYSPWARYDTRMSRDETDRQASRHAWTLERGGDCTCLSSHRAPLPSPLALAASRSLASTTPSPPTPPPSFPAHTVPANEPGRFRFVRAGAAVHQSLLVPAPAFDDRVAAARSVIARL